MSVARQFFRRGTRTAPTVDLSEATKGIKELVDAGLNPNEAAKYILGGGGAGAAVAQQGGGLMREIGASLVGSSLVAAPGAIANFLTEGSATPQTVPMGGKGFIFTPQDQLQYTRYYNSPYMAFMRGVFNKEMPNPEEYRKEQTASVDRQMQGANEREIRKIMAERQATGQIEAMKAAALLEGERVRAESALGVQEIASLGDVQKTRIQSGNEAASAMLQKAIENIAYVEKLGNSDTRSALAALPSI